jgi:hypothetical protein
VTDPEAVEFWPDYSGALLHVAGAPIQLTDLPIPADVVIRATAWVGGYDDSKLPFGDRPDDDWMAEGRALFAVIRTCLAADDITLIDWEGIWAVAPQANREQG